jgi:hypothetical protein
MVDEQNRVRTLYRKLLTLYPQPFKEQLGESMEQTFQDLWNEKRQKKKELFGFVLWTFVETAMGILIDLSNKHRTNGEVAIFLKEGTFEGAGIEFVQEAIR